jgi:hypothetical protein
LPSKQIKIDPKNQLNGLSHEPDPRSAAVTQVSKPHGGVTAVKQMHLPTSSLRVLTSTTATLPETQQTTLQPNSNSTAKMVYTLVVHLYAKDDAESISKLVAKLQEASQVYSNDKETLGW